MLKPFYLPIGLLIAGLVINLSFTSTHTVNGITTCSGQDWAKVVLGVVAAIVALMGFGRNAAIAIVLALLGAAMVAWGLNVGGLIC